MTLHNNILYKLLRRCCSRSYQRNKGWNPGGPPFDINVSLKTAQTQLVQAHRNRLLLEENEISQYPRVEVVLIDSVLSYEAHAGVVGQGRFRIVCVCGNRVLCDNHALM